MIAVKVAHSEYCNLNLKHEKDIYELISAHEHPSIPKFYKYFPATNDSSRENCSNVVLITELLGESMEDLLKKNRSFSVVTSMKIGLQVVSRFNYQIVQQFKMK